MIINLTQHDATLEQKQAGVINLAEPAKSHVREALTFDELPSHNKLLERALAIAGFVEQMEGVTHAMIGGAPFFMPVLETELRHIGIIPLYAFSRRECTEIEGVKKSVFRHIGFVEGTIEVEDMTKVRRRIEDRLRKDKQFLRRIAEIAGEL